MKLRNDIERRTIVWMDGYEIDGLAHVQGIDARVDGRGVVIERQAPTSIVVRRGTGEERIDMPPEQGVRMMPAMLIAPAAFVVMRWMFRSKKRRSK